MITYSNTKPITPEQFAQVLRNSGIIRPVDDLDRMAKMLAGANCTWSAWDGDRLVGIARAMTDFCYACYLSDLAVDKDYQKQGIGKTLVARMQEDIGEDVALILLAAPAAMSYYPHLGFERHRGAYIVPRKPFS